MAELRLRAAVSTRDSELQSKIPPLMDVCMLVFGDQEEELIAIWSHQRKGEEVMSWVESSRVVKNSVGRGGIPEPSPLVLKRKG